MPGSALWIACIQDPVLRHMQKQECQGCYGVFRFFGYKWLDVVSGFSWKCFNLVSIHLPSPSDFISWLSPTCKSSCDHCVASKLPCLAPRVCLHFLSKWKPHLCVLWNSKPLRWILSLLQSGWLFLFFPSFGLWPLLNANRCLLGVLLFPTLMWLWVFGENWNYPYLKYPFQADLDTVYPSMLRLQMSVSGRDGL